MIEFYAERQDFDSSCRIIGRITDDRGVHAIVATGIEIRPMEKGQFWPVFIDLPCNFENMAQALFDALWKAGLRPKSGESSVAHVQALKDHLADMQKLVFKEAT